ncbi:hypothetical protein GYMLUDRAFT_42329 [Collybiopsis luxurians FD-317 M1]|uniref:Uncharacterized protein n=1 Tax=Collybiopsis luxurians FD-317 M1 TaxID=944289 RepID=A0A0D0BDU3_9AGAR|nr:hypothetical protein GYMLUDRAFT_42329 [Collybiopsis luxurians FD-317 M1]
MVIHPVWISLSANVFTGQIITAIIVITFMAIFPLREWITQNARPGLNAAFFSRRLFSS